MADIIRTEELGRCFRTTGGEFWALKNISIQVPEGRLTILKGRSGSGKTTLMTNLGAPDRPRRAAKRPPPAHADWLRVPVRGADSDDDGA